MSGSFAPQRVLLPYDVVRSVARLAGWDYAELRARSRTAELSRARFIAAGLLKLRGWSFTEIGWALGRDRATVRSAYRRCRQLAVADPDFRRRLAASDAALRALERRALG